ncbi:hypothetical protein [Aquiflexum sp.]
MDCFCLPSACAEDFGAMKAWAFSKIEENVVELIQQATILRLTEYSYIKK